MKDLALGTVVLLNVRQLLVFLALFSTLVVGVGKQASAEPSPPTEGQKPVDFQRQILPILSENCLLCHGPDSTSREAGLRLDVRDSATSQLDSGSHAIVPGSIEQSELVRRIISSDSSERMPPDETGKKLTNEQVQLLATWVSQGAEYAKHWAFESIVRPPVPQLEDDSWVRNPIDSFVLSRMIKGGLSPSQQATKEKLVRRLYFDFIGLPPTPEQIDEFKSDSKAGAVRHCVDQLLQSKYYGEHMAVDWLDGARYADSNGYQNDFSRSMWVWRDWVIQAFNEQMPFDQFTIEQVAGDLLPNATKSQVVATGFNRNNRTVTEAGSLPEEWLVENVVDRVETTSTVFLGLTLGCCRCHDHKYDPISQQDFFEFFAFFNNVEEKGVYTEKRGNVPPLIVAPTLEQEEELERLTKATSATRSRLVDTTQSRASQLLKNLPSQGLSDIQGEIFRFISSRNEKSGEKLANERSGLSADLQREQGVVGLAVRLNGTGGIECEEHFPADPTQAFTETAWIKPERGKGAVVSAIDDHDAFRGGDVLILDDMRIAFHLIQHWPDNAIKVTTRESIPKSTWSHIAVTYDGTGKGSGVSLYLNGVRQQLDVLNDSLTGPSSSALPFRIGQRSSGSYFEGSISDIRIFDRVLENNEIQSLIESALLAQLAKLTTEREPESMSELAFFLASYQGFEFGSELNRVQEEYQEAQEAEKAMRDSFPTVMVMKDRETRRPTYLLKRGEYDKPDKTKELFPDVPDCLPPLRNSQDVPDRLALAKWLVDPSNPLTARVTVNRLWAKFFGRGLVPTTNNFGLQAELPSHPELLDWLAAEFIDSGWNVQHIQRLIATSATYQQSSNVTREKRKADPYNILLARGPRLRLSAEQIRDNALAVSGLLTNKVGGPSVMPYQPDGLWSELAGGAHETYTQAEGPSLYRRSLYIYRKRTVPHPTMSTFDAPSWEICQVERGRTNTPLQALALLNDVTYVEAARKLAERMIREVEGSPREKIAYGFRLATSRRPSRKELNVLASSLLAYQADFRSDASGSEEFVSHGQSQLPSEVDTTRLAAYTAVAATILNLDETITKE